MIYIIKIGDTIYENIEPHYIDENNKKIWNIPQDIEEFKTVAIDTINWVIGQEIKKRVDNNLIQLSTSNSKGIMLLAKVLKGLNPDTSSLSELDQSNFDKMVNLADNGYADSELLSGALNAVEVYISKGVERVTAIINATTHDEIIEILNQDW